MMAGGPVRGDTLPKLLSLIEGTQRGVVGTPESKAEIIAVMDRIEEANAVFIAKDRGFLQKCSGTWELLWTTEKETLFFQRSGLLGSAVTLITQTIDAEAGLLNNLISFENGRELSVTGAISADPATKGRINFAFTKARLVVPPFDLGVPPVGKGWFQTVFVNDKFRLSRDVRGDYLVSRRLT